MDIILELSKINPVVELFHGEVVCFFCGAEEITSLKPLQLEQHENNCIWKAAKQKIQRLELVTDQ